MQYLFYKGQVIALDQIERILKYERNDKEFPYVIKLQLKDKEVINFAFDNEEDRDNGYEEVIEYIR